MRTKKRYVLKRKSRKMRGGNGQRLKELIKSTLQQIYNYANVDNLDELVEYINDDERENYKAYTKLPKFTPNLINLLDKELREASNKYKSINNPNTNDYVEIRVELEDIFLKHIYCGELNKAIDLSMRPLAYDDILDDLEGELLKLYEIGDEPEDEERNKYIDDFKGKNGRSPTSEEKLQHLMERSTNLARESLRKAHEK